MIFFVEILCTGKSRVHFSSDFHHRVHHENHRLRICRPSRSLSEKFVELVGFYHRRHRVIIILICYYHVPSCYQSMASVHLGRCLVGPEIIRLNCVISCCDGLIQERQHGAIDFDEGWL